MDTRARIAQLEEEIKATEPKKEPLVAVHRLASWTPAVKLQTIEGMQGEVFAAASPLIRWHSWRLLAYQTTAGRCIVHLLRREY